MDMGLFRGVVTAILFVAYCLLMVRTFSKRRKAHYEEAARIPLDDD